MEAQAIRELRRSKVQKILQTLRYHIRRRQRQEQELEQRDDQDDANNDENNHVGSSYHHHHDRRRPRGDSSYNNKRLVRIAKALEYRLWVRADGDVDEYKDDSTLSTRLREIVLELRHDQGH
eukprot:CAMPEP_0194032538 /NCGR_PEP_ID=MMETSP0009_2-20130614/5459_1 /TAXON_ID=210454 /ORGANISM="Grammatophora oceanica, Strain CCMP 410" /LENGTH=121 /DNA_ID=CAMNT_0038673013 /DNA_START=1223 /DNA_END=1588 /DNA_ORIENTATION=+